MHPTVVINVVGLTQDLLGDDTPHINALVKQGGVRPLSTVTPSVTCSVQATNVKGGEKLYRQGGAKLYH